MALPTRLDDARWMAAGQFLSAAERDRLSTFPKNISREDAAAYFTLTGHDLKLVLQTRGGANRLGLALTLGALRFLGFFPHTLDGLPSRAVARVAGQIGVSPETPLYPRRAQTRTVHQQRAAKHLGFRKASRSELRDLELWLVEQAAAHARPSALLSWAASRLLQRRVIRPGLTVLERMVLKARREAEARTALALRAVTEPNEPLLDAVIAARPEEGRTLLAWLREREGSNSPTSIRRMLERYAWLRSAGVSGWNLSAIHPNRRRYLARLGATANPQMLRRMPTRRRYPALAAYLSQALVSTTDEVLDMFDRCLGEHMGKARRLALDQRQQGETARDDIAGAFRLIAQVIMAQDVSDTAVRREVFERISPRAINSLLAACDADVQPADLDGLTLLRCRYSRIRAFSGRFIALMPFRSSGRGRRVLAALETVRYCDKNKARLPVDAPLAFAPTRWRPLIVTAAGIDRGYYELCMLWQLRDALRSGAVWVDGSRRYAGDTEYELEIEGSLEAKPMDTLTVPGSPTVALARKADSLTDLAAAACEAAVMGAVRVEAGKVVLSPHDSIDRPSSLIELETAVAHQLPRVDLSALLVEVERWTSFSEELRHAGEDGAPTGKAYHHTMAAILAQACNVGFTRMAEASEATFEQLAWANAWHLSETTLKSAFTAVVDHHHAQPLSASWGGGTLSSSDGQRFTVRGGVAAARALPRYFGYGRGVTYYTWTSDQFSQYGTKVIPATARDATYVLDEILDNETELEVLEHTTDTAGYTDLIFALFDLLGMRFAPRIRDSGSAVLYRLQDAPFEWEELRSAQTIRRSVIADHWDDMLRVAALLKSGHVTASLLVGRLQARRDHGVARALIAYGRLCKTEHLLRYLAGEEYRRRIGHQLNKGEALHALRRFLVFGNLARLQAKDGEALSNQAACLNLVTNAVVLWNTVYMGRVLDRRRRQGLPTREEDVRRLSPARYEHINPYGKYRFDALPPPGSFRPLRA